ncbi:MAG: caspase family protein [Pseudomonadota bacterium]
MFVLLRAVLALTLLAAPAQASERIALIIGNGAYDHVPALDNPGADARLIARTLGALGFEVTLKIDGTQSEMKRAIAEFGRRLRNAGPDAVSLFYYAGHGVQAQGANYLVPTDAMVADEADLYLVGVEADWVLRQMASARIRTSIVILDACRDNPFAEQGLQAQGLARMNAPTGSFVAYSTSPGAVALDGAGANSPFTSALAHELTVPNRPIEEVFRAVRAQVVAQTSGMQTPWDSSSLIDAFYFVEGNTPSSPSAAETQLWNSVRDSGDLVELALFLRAYPDSVYAEEARRMIVARSSSASEQPVASAPAPTAVPAREPQPRADTPAPPAADTAQDLYDEEAMFAAAMATDVAAAFQAYLDVYPNGRFVAQAKERIALLTDPAQAAVTAPAPPAERPSDSAPADPVEPVDIAQLTVTFETPLPLATRALRGRSLREIVSSSPDYPPIEGLNPSLWQGQPCSACHQWTADALCTQGQFYLAAPEARIVGKKHPFGEEFLSTLARWAETGCN